MGRAATKADLLNAAISNYDKLNTLINSMSERDRNTDFYFSNDEKKKEAHWNRDKNLRDVYIHLYEWHQLLLNWIEANQKGDEKPFIPLPYNWKTYGEMNIKFWQKHQNTSLEEAKDLFTSSHKDVINAAESFTNEELFAKNTFKWVGGSTLGSYFVSATASHYEWAMKKFKAHILCCKNNQ